MDVEKVAEILMVIANEYDDFLPKGGNKDETDARIEIKINTWYEALKSFDFETVSKATGLMLQTHTYGTPKLAHLMTLLNPVMEKENIGQEFAERFIYLVRKLGADNMENAIFREYGDIGREIYLNNKHDARQLNEADAGTFKAQIRNSFNSKYERKQKGHDVIENEVTLMIENQFFGTEVTAIE